MAYHINPATGKVGACNAQKQCPFGDLEKDHYASPAQAYEAYEAQMHAQTFTAPEVYYRSAAVKAYEWVNTLHGQNNDIPAHQLHKELAEAYEGLAVAAESFRLRLTDPAQREQWNVTAATARVSQLKHEQAHHALLPRDLRGNREARLRTTENLRAQLEAAEREAAEVTPEYFYSPALGLRVAEKINPEFSFLTEEEKQEQISRAWALHSALEFHGGNEELAAADYHRYLVTKGVVTNITSYGALSQEEQDFYRQHARLAHQAMGR